MQPQTKVELQVFLRINRNIVKYCTLKIDLLKLINHLSVRVWKSCTVKIVENPSIVEKFQLTEESAIEGFYCMSRLLYRFSHLKKWILAIWLFFNKNHHSNNSDIFLDKTIFISHILYIKKHVSLIFAGLLT